MEGSTIGIIIFVVIFIAVCGYIIYQRKTRDKIGGYLNDRLVDLGIDPKRYAQFKKTYFTPLGAEIRSTVTDIPQAFLTAYDEEIQRVIRNHTRKYPHWKNGLEVKDYPAILIDPMTTNQETAPGSPAIIVAGEFQTAGTVVGTFPQSLVKPPRLVLPHQSQQGWRFEDYWRVSVYNEGEHSIECRNDYGVFQSYSGPNDVHRHVDDEPTGVVGLRSETKVQASCAGKFG